MPALRPHSRESAQIARLHTQPLPIPKTQPNFVNRIIGGRRDDAWLSDFGRGKAAGRGRQGAGSRPDPSRHCWCPCSFIHDDVVVNEFGPLCPPRSPCKSQIDDCYPPGILTTLISIAEK